MMRQSYAWAALAIFAAGLSTAGCSRMPGYPKPGPEVVRPDEVKDFATLYAQNCAGCHGAECALATAASRLACQSTGRRLVTRSSR